MWGGGNGGGRWRDSLGGRGDRGWVLRDRFVGGIGGASWGGGGGSVGIGIVGLDRWFGGPSRIRLPYLEGDLGF